MAVWPMHQAHASGSVSSPSPQATARFSLCFLLVDKLYTPVYNRGPCELQHS